ncbi:arginase family protein [Microvirga sp. W0021]|uniref:Arginase family protein n=1 Tax=Hohaiivirga grylli TaxID=3133970 RepID=A0ABV0BKY0_9HYPH
MAITLTTFQGRCGDRNGKGTPGARALAKKLAKYLTLQPEIIGKSTPAAYEGWEAELKASRAGLRELSEHLAAIVENGTIPVTTIPRCTAALATIPVIAQQYPDACIIWFDAHPDLNTPENTASGYLGGMVLAAAAGLWESGLGKGLKLENIALAGARDIDPPEQELISKAALPALSPSELNPQSMLDALAGRPVYIHIDCDVFDPSELPAEYVCPNGITMAQLHSVFDALATRGDIIGLEISEFETQETVTEQNVLATQLVNALSPVLNYLRNKTT